MAGYALFCAVVALAVALAKRLTCRHRRPVPDRRFWIGLDSVPTVICVGLAWHYFRHRFLMGDKYDRVIVSDKDLEAFACSCHASRGLGTPSPAMPTSTVRPGWDKASPGCTRCGPTTTTWSSKALAPTCVLFWAYADNADRDPRIAEAVWALNIRYVITSSPVSGAVMPDGLVSYWTSPCRGRRSTSTAAPASTSGGEPDRRTADDLFECGAWMRECCADDG